MKYLMEVFKDIKKSFEDDCKKRVAEEILSIRQANIDKVNAEIKLLEGIYRQNVTLTEAIWSRKQIIRDLQKVDIQC